MVIGCFGGSSKPANLEEFLRPLVTEINNLQQTGLRFGERVIPFRLRAFIADSPMRAFLKGTVNFNGLHGCLKCTAVGMSVRTAKGRKVVIDAVNAPPRTDAGFRSRAYNGHHLGCTPLEEITNFDMIEGVPVGDRLHLIDEGVTKKILNGMIDNSFNKQQFIHWLPLQRKVVSAFLEKSRLPFENKDELLGYN
ncbi:uncharacterized protein LOC131293772 [Anopheles ziemanni]|uniref:uncharacterized protein LOC131264554 n=1 Tax=Anopheles coustani TaxID=139045 RepID=UPI0026590BEE|nr:uncharacterized protein LOC131264554 [Anopheles coustani]XP_058177816.1 uncharacterized protein LOC131293772 [Anopheles ziemanni]